MALSRLLVSTLAFRKTRAALTVAAVGLAISLVVAITSGYASAEAVLQQFVRYYVGSSSIEMAPKGDPSAVVDTGLIQELEKDSAVRQAVGRLEADVVLGVDKAGESVPQITATAIGVHLPADAQVQAMKRDAGEWFEGAAGDVAVIDQVIAQRLDLKLGDEMLLLHPERPLKVQIVGIVHKPALLALHMHTVYLPLETLQRFAGREGKVSRVFVDLKSETEEEAFAQRWQPKAEQMEPVLRLRRAGQRQQEMQRNLEGVQIMSYMGGTVAMLAATFIVFTTLSMGVAERTRSLAMLRAVGAERRQIGKLVVLEGTLLAAAGAAVGVPLGILWVHWLALYHNTLFSAGVVLSGGGMMFAVVGMIAAAIIASFMPAWSAMRIKPLDAMAPLGQPTRPRAMALAAAIGTLLLAVDPLIIFSPAVPREFKFYAHFVLGLPALFVGFFLLGPLIVWLVERTLGYVVAMLLRLDYPLLRQQLTGSLWRAAGTAAALMVGLAILVAMQVQGTTLLSGWRLPDRFPDVFIVAPLGLDREQQKILETAPGVTPGEVLPIAVSSPQLGIRLFSIGSTSYLPDATMFFGIDPDKTLKMIEFEYYEGNAEEAMQKLKQGRHLIVTNEFRQLKGIGVGDKLPLKTPMSGMVEYTVAAVVWSPGLDVIVSAFDMGRQLEQRTVASVCGSLEDARRDFGVDRINLFAANLQVGVEREELATTLSDRMDQATTGPSTQATGGSFLTRGLGVLQLKKILGKYGFLVGDVRHIKYEMQQGFKRMLLLLSTVALAAIVVASLGVTNTIMASIRSRQWQFGVLRSVGVTRGQLLRLILAEALLLGFAGCVLGLGAGFLMSLDANGLSRAMLGYGPPITVPWDIVWIGVGIIVGVAVLASLAPAISAARRQPLQLLQWGRASA